MKKTYLKMKLFVALFALAATSMTAQLAGIYTINSAVPTGGANFQTFNALKTALVAGGVSGPVTVNVVANSGPYNEQVDFPQIVGASAINNITINGNGNVLTFNGTVSAPWTLGLNGADFFTVNNLTVDGTNGTYALACHLWNIASDNSFNNCTFNCPVGSSSTPQVPFSISGSGTSATSSGNAGNNNIVTGCTMNWGYYGIALYGWTSSPYTTNNRIIDCTVRDFYFYGIYHLYMRQSIVRGNTIERPNRNNITTTYGMLFSTGSYQLTCEKNKIQKLYEGNPGQSTTTYGIMHTFASALGFESNIRNNLINVTKTNGFVAGLYCYGSYSNIFHNTVAIDDANSGGTNTTYGAYGYGTNTFYKNNNISITRGGGGSRWGLYYPSTMANGASNGNNVWLQNGTMYYGYYWANGNMATLANWQTVNGFDANSFNTDPLFMNAAILNYMPGSNVMNNGGQVLNVTDDILGASRSLATPDPGAYEYFNVPCAGTPTVNTTITPTTIVCPNSSIGAYLANSYTTSGHTFQWQVSNLSAVGPWTPITTGTTSALSTTIGSTVLWYSAVVTCTNGGSNITAAGASVNVAGTTINNVPYFEGFEGIGSNGKLPNCSWTASNLQNTCFTYTSSQATLRIPRTGNSFANFYYLPAQSNFFWSNGIQMEPGVTYSISTWYITDPNSYTNWNLNLMISPNQSTVGANVVATTGGAAVAPVYKSLSNTFTVATSGIYYIGVNGVSTGACCGNYLTWDDLEVIVPCSLNQPNMTVSSSSQTVCAGQSVVLTAVGADSFAWSNGATSNVITVNPQIPTMYSVVGTNTASSCSATINQMVNVFPTPQVTIFAPVTSICIGSSANLIGVGANTYTWSNASNSGNITVSPSSTTTYSLIGANSFGCSANTTQVITVNPLPSVGINSSNANGLACETDITTLTGSGAATYQWASNNGVVVGNPINVTPASTITYTVYGTSAQGCTNVSTYELTVTNCVGLASQNGVNTAIMLYPNPNNGTFTIDWNTNDSKSAEVMDVTGRVILSTTNSANHINMDMSNFANGVYYVKLYSDASTEVIKVVKQ